MVVNVENAMLAETEVGKGGRKESSLEVNGEGCSPRQSWWVEQQRRASTLLVSLRPRLMEGGRGRSRLGEDRGWGSLIHIMTRDLGTCSKTDLNGP